MPAALTSTPVTGLRNNFTGHVGFRFTVGARPLRVTHLGRWKVAGNSQAHTFKLTNVATLTDVPGATASLDMTGGSAGTYVYAALASPVVLPAGQAYFFGTSETNGGDQWHDEGAVTGSADLTVNQAGYNNGSWVGALVGGSYVPPNFLYELTNLLLQRRRRANA